MIVTLTVILKKSVRLACLPENWWENVGIGGTSGGCEGRHSSGMDGKIKVYYPSTPQLPPCLFNMFCCI